MAINKCRSPGFRTEAISLVIDSHLDTSKISQKHMVTLAQLINNKLLNSKP